MEMSFSTWKFHFIHWKHRFIRCSHPRDPQLLTPNSYPLMTVSVRNQVAAKNQDARPGLAGQVDMVRKIVSEEGITGLYSGLESALFGIALTNGVYYYWYEWVKAGFEKAAGIVRPMTTLESLAAGALAGSATAVATNPIWVVNTRLTAKQDRLSDGIIRPKPKNTWEAFVQIIQDDGPASLFQGIVPALILVINPIIQYTVFEQLKARMEAGGRKLANFDFFMLGAISKLCATGITYVPLRFI
jgi:adenine nucleotide transporter 17